MKKSPVNKRLHTDMRGFSLIELTVAMAILMLILGTLSMLIGSVNNSYAQHRPRIKAINDANAALDTITRLLRMAGNNPNNIANLQAIDPGAAVGGVYRTIRIRADWRVTDGALDDEFEDVTFSAANGKLMLTAGGGTATAFLDSVQSLRFTYYDGANALIGTPTTGSNIRRVEVEITTPATAGINNSAMTFTASAWVRGRSF